ncbi:MAG: hypothetical protein A2939_03925 [Parcubacteria group bacterium RIFCSPLOWO2_01_FULL_48_18]|nr:MAG: hypothetical protein A2939_03925 [Parcubacteria group bacterium RIFCSPLOWO2_01_FULL_48_18]
MAIIVKEKRKLNWFALSLTVIALVFAGASTYFLFFKTPPLVEILQPTADIRRREISTIRLEPDKVLNNPLFQKLTRVPLFLEPKEIGRANPFIPFPTSTFSGISLPEEEPIPSQPAPALTPPPPVSPATSSPPTP